MSKKKTQRQQVVLSQLPEIEIGGKDVKFTVRVKGAKLGDLTVSRGGLGWFPSGPSQERHFTWKAFAELVKSVK